MSTAHEIIKRPVITEKSTTDAALGKYTFEVAVGATKTEVRKAVEQLFDVKVLKVNTANYDGKTKRQGVHVGQTASWKKAVVTIDTDPKAESYLQKGGKSATASKKYKNTIEEFGFGQ